MSFSGLYFHSLDVKNRLFIPVKFRDRLGEEFVLFKGPDKCLYIYDKERFEEIGEQFVNSPDRAAQRAFFSQAAEVTPDKQGRVTLTPEQLAHAGISKDAVFVGAGKRIEVWSPENYENATVELSEIDKTNTFIF